MQKIQLFLTIRLPLEGIVYNKNSNYELLIKRLLIAEGFSYLLVYE